MGELFKKKIFWVLMLMMLCAGASEQAVSQWASTLAEKSFGINKTIGDLAGQGHFMGNLEIISIWNALCNSLQFCAWFPI